MIERRHLLLYAYKAFIYISIAAVIYIFTVGLFTSPALEDTADNTSYTFDLSTISNNSSAYFQINNRQLLAIRANNQFYIYWANDPIYGCKLEYKSDLIIPVCIKIKYSIQGEQLDSSQKLNSPEFKITADSKLVVYL